MKKLPKIFSTLNASLAVGVMALGLSVPAQAVVYDFKMTGGASSSLAWVSSHLFVEVTEDLTTSANDVLFKFTNEIPILTRLCRPQSLLFTLIPERTPACSPACQLRKHTAL